MQNANAYPAYQHPNPNRSIALVPEQIIKNLKFMNRKNTNAASLLYFFCNFLTRFFVAVLAISPSDS
jgi:hypothetical protein